MWRHHKDTRRGDRIFAWSMWGLSFLVLCLLLGIAYELLTISAPAYGHLGFRFLLDSDWNPVTEKFGALTFIYGTVVSAVLALVIAMPISIGVGLFLTDLAPRKVASVLGFLVEMLAAIPSVVYGLWGVFVLAPVLRTTVEPWLTEYFGFLPFFQGPAFGVGMLAAAVILAIMITPTVTSICREVFRSIPITQREAALGLGATKTEMIRISVLKESLSGIFGAGILGLVVRWAKRWPSPWSLEIARRFPLRFLLRHRPWRV